jgi:hypothetical protein
VPFVNAALGPLRHRRNAAADDGDALAQAKALDPGELCVFLVLSVQVPDLALEVAGVAVFARTPKVIQGGRFTRGKARGGIPGAVCAQRTPATSCSATDVAEVKARWTLP